MISFGYNAVPSDAESDLIKVFRRGRYSPDKKVREFEEKFAKLHHARHGIFVNSGTDALRLSLLALKEKSGWKDGDKVIVPALTFVATINAVIQSGLEPVFADVGLDYTMNIYSVGHESTCDERKDFWGDPELRAILPVHLFGKRCDDRIYALAKKYKLAVLEDSCETVLNPLRGDISCHSLYMAHHVTAGVGGMALTNDGDLNYLIRSYANHGRNTDYLPGYFSAKLSKDLLKKRFRFDRGGYSCRATEFQAVLGLAQLDHIQENVEGRRATRRRLCSRLNAIDFPDLQVGDGMDADDTAMMFPIILKEGDKYDLCLHLEKSGIETRDMMPIVSQPCFAKYFKDDSLLCPEARKVDRTGFYIPCNPGQNVNYVREVFRKYFTA